jgi:hypothetical protein
MVLVSDVPRPLLGRINVVLSWFSELKRRVPAR